MTVARPSHAAPDPITVLREYRALAPWSLRDLSALAGAILGASGVYPLNAAARARPTERTIRFYVAQGLVSPPEGRGTAAIYTYRHLLQVLAIKLRQMEGATLGAITRDLQDQGGDVVERRVAAALGPGLPPPDRLMLPPQEMPRGKVGRVMNGWSRPAEPVPGAARPSTCRRVPLEVGLELLIDERHPLFHRPAAEQALAETLRDAIGRAVGGEEA